MMTPSNTIVETKNGKAGTLACGKWPQMVVPKRFTTPLDIFAAGVGALGFGPKSPTRHTKVPRSALNPQNKPTQQGRH
jgi:hypothetical protein